MKNMKIKPRETLIILIGALFIVLVLYLLYIFTKEDTVCIESHCFQVELARSVEEKTKGLSFRENLSLDSGMLFIFDKESRYSFWMKDTLIPLDIIWINSSFNVVSIKSDSLPCPSEGCEVISPHGNARYVLEINAGLSERYGFSSGDKARIYIRK